MNLRGEGARQASAGPDPRLALHRRGWADANAAMDRLFELFPDKYPSVGRETADEWEFNLGWPRHLLEHVDPALPERASTCFGLSLADLHDYVEVRRAGNVDIVFSMFHSWALLAPALATASGGMPPPLTIVHVDAHHDLAASLLSPAGTGRIRNPEYGVECRTDDPASVTSAITAGFVNKGSFLTAYLAASEPGTLVHVEPGIAPISLLLHARTDRARVGDALVTQTLVAFVEGVASEHWQLFETPALPNVLPGRARSAVWLDVDLDAFCNRFDGDSDRRALPGSAEEEATMRERIDRFLDDLQAATWIRDVRVVSVAASPGFFPSAYWEHAVPRVRDGLASVFSAL